MGNRGVLHDEEGRIRWAWQEQRRARSRLDRLVPDHRRLAQINPASYRHVICPT
jgi:hypothetical protein